MDIKIDKMQMQDLENISSNLTYEFDDFWNYNILKQELLSETSHLFVAKTSDNTIVGFVGVQLILDEASITNIVTKISSRNQGIGSLLLEYAINFSKNNGMSNITLEVNEKNIYAIKLYKKFGFEQTGLRKKYYNGSDNAIIMTLKF